MNMFLMNIKVRVRMIFETLFELMALFKLSEQEKYDAAFQSMCDQGHDTFTVLASLGPRPKK